MSTVPSIEAPERDLLSVAEEHEQHARELRREAAQLEADAALYAELAREARTEYDCQARQPLEMLHPAIRLAKGVDLKLASKLAECVEQIGPCKVSAIGEHVGISAKRASWTLRKLRDQGLLEQSGMKRGSMWALPGQIDAIPNDRSNYRFLIRDAVRRLGTCTQAEIEAELPALSGATVRRHLTELHADGVLERERIGRSYAYAYVDPEGATPARPRQAPPEVAFIQRQRGAVAVGGRSHHKRATRRDVRQRLRAVQQQGATIKPVKHGYLIELDGKVVTAIPKTASDHRSLKNTDADLKRGGLRT